MKISVNSTFSYIKFNLNYGSVLQCFALQKYLRKRGHDASLLRDYRANPMNTIKRLIYLRYPKLFASKFLALVKLQGFVRRNIVLSERGYLSYRQLIRQCPDADCHIAGSDQIWHDSKNFRYLTYVPDDKIKLSYAASFGVPNISDEMKATIKPYLKSFNAISVREESGVKIINDIGYPATHVLDPTLLLDKEEYPYEKDVSRLTGNKKFVYCYFLNLKDLQDLPFIEIRNYAIQNNLEIYITAPLNYGLFREYALLFPSVEEWLGLYNQADCIFTNTYHGLLFCMIFQKQFVFFCNSRTQGIDRFTSILTWLGLEDRIVSDDSLERVDSVLKQKIDYTQIQNRIECLREATDFFFREAGI